MEENTTTTIQCTCTTVVRGNYDFSRNCFRYTCVMQPVSDGDDVFLDSDLFESDYKIPVRDSQVRAKNAELAAKAVCSGSATSPVMPASDVLSAWDEIVKSHYVGKKTAIDTVTMSVSELSDGKAKEYVVEIGTEKHVVASRNIVALHGRLEKAIARTKNQIARYLAKEEGEES